MEWDVVVKSDAHRIIGVIAGCFFVIMAGITACLIMEYRFYEKQVRELAELKGYYESSVAALQKHIEESQHASMIAAGAQEADKDQTQFVVVDRGQQHLKHEALKFARNHNLEKPLKQLYDKESVVSGAPRKETTSYRSHRVRKVTRRVTVKNQASKKRIQKAREIVAKVFGELNWPWPVERSCFWISSHFGPRKKANGAWGYHTGIDLAAVKGTTVRAVAAGVVEEAWFDKVGYGNTVVIRHSKKLKTRYAHLATLSVKKGDHVPAGTKIGTVGNTGHVRKRNGRDGTHLHFEVYVGKKRMNPLYFLNER